MTSSTVLAALGYSPSPVRSRRRAAFSRADAICTAERRIADLQADIEPNRQLSTSLAFDAELRATDAMFRA